MNVTDATSATCHPFYPDATTEAKLEVGGNYVVYRFDYEGVATENNFASFTVTSPSPRGYMGRIHSCFEWNSPGVQTIPLEAFGLTPNRLGEWDNAVTVRVAEEPIRELHALMLAWRNRHDDYAAYVLTRKFPQYFGGVRS